MMKDERRSCLTDEAQADRMVRLTQGLFAAEGSDAWNGAKAVLRQLAEEDPETAARLRAWAAIRRAGLRSDATAH